MHIYPDSDLTSQELSYPTLNVSVSTHTHEKNLHLAIEGKADRGFGDDDLPLRHVSFRVLLLRGQSVERKA